jgi:hypothetical protein
MKVSKRTEKMPTPLATPEEAMAIRRYLFEAGRRSFSNFAMEAILEKMAREPLLAAPIEEPAEALS